MLFRTGDQSKDFVVVLATNRPGERPLVPSMFSTSELWGQYLGAEPLLPGRYYP
jgi:hypothetical protein